MAIRMEEFDCKREGQVKTVQASNPLSACKKAFRSARGWHWTEVEGSSNLWVHPFVKVYRKRKLVGTYGQEDNG